MPPRPCPLRLQRLINRENALPASEPHPLRQIRRAFQDKKKGKGWETFVVGFPSDVTINLTDCTVRVQNELALALADISSPDMIDMIRDCPVCGDLFWAGRAEKEACDRHKEQWRKQRQRRNEKRKQAEVDSERDAAQLEKTIRGLSKTATAVIIAIMAGHCRLFHNIDQEACYGIGQTSWERIPSSYVVRQTLAMLVKRGYLEHYPAGNPLEDRYEPEDKLSELWAAVQRARSIAT